MNNKGTMLFSVPWLVLLRGFGNPGRFVFAENFPAGRFVISFPSPWRRVWRFRHFRRFLETDSRSEMCGRTCCTLDPRMRNASTSWSDLFNILTPTSWTSSALAATRSRPCSATLKLSSCVSAVLPSCVSQLVDGQGSQKVYFTTINWSFEF